MHTYTFNAAFGRDNTFTITINADDTRSAVIRMQKFCEGGTFVMTSTSEQ